MNHLNGSEFKIIQVSIRFCIHDDMLRGHILTVRNLACYLKRRTWNISKFVSEYMGLILTLRPNPKSLTTTSIAVSQFRPRATSSWNYSATIPITNILNDAPAGESSIPQEQRTIISVLAKRLELGGPERLIKSKRFLDLRRESNSQGALILRQLLEHLLRRLLQYVVYYLIVSPHITTHILNCSLSEILLGPLGPIPTLQTFRQ